MSPAPAAKPPRRPHKRTEITRSKLLDAAATLFVESGFGGVSIRDIENAAKVQRGLLAYHFKDKETLWKAMADRIFNVMGEELALRLEILTEMSARERVAFIIRFYVRFSSRHPDLSRLLSQEGRHDSWRIRYLVDQHIAANMEDLRGPVRDALDLSERQFMHWYYLMAGGSSLIFSHAPECKLLFGEDAHDDSIVDAHAEMMVSYLLGPAS